VSHKSSPPFCVPLQQASSSSCRFLLSLTNSCHFILQLLTAISHKQLSLYTAAAHCSLTNSCHCILQLLTAISHKQLSLYTAAAHCYLKQLSLYTAAAHCYLSHTTVTVYCSCSLLSPSHSCHCILQLLTAISLTQLSLYTAAAHCYLSQTAVTLYCSCSLLLIWRCVLHGVKCCGADVSDRTAAWSLLRIIVISLPHCTTTHLIKTYLCSRCATKLLQSRCLLISKKLNDWVSTSTDRSDLLSTWPYFLFAPFVAEFPNFDSFQMRCKIWPYFRN
jgi:hypothetical protein